MATYVILSKLSPHSFDEPGKLKDIAKRVSREIKEQCPGVTWKQSFATLGRFDVVDVVESDKPEEVARAAMIIRATGKASTETLPATPWEDFLNSLT